MRNELALTQINEKLESLRTFIGYSSGVSSWIQFIRKALGLSVKQLSTRTKLASSTLHQLERAETDGGITINKLRQLAVALDCELHYAFIPNRPIKDLIQDQAHKRAKSIVNESQLQMEYEDQAVDGQRLKAQVRELTQQLKFSKQLWDD